MRLPLRRAVQPELPRELPYLGARLPHGRYLREGPEVAQLVLVGHLPARRVHVVDVALHDGVPLDEQGEGGRVGGPSGSPTRAELVAVDEEKVRSPRPRAERRPRKWGSHMKKA